MSDKKLEMNPVGWFEIYIQDMARATKFYETVLDINLDKLPSPVEMEIEMMCFPMEMGLAGAAGALVKMDGFPSGGNSTLVYFVCEDCAMEASRVEAAGGSIHKPKMSIGQYGFIVLAVDTEGNMFGLHSQQ
ncbi:VOC family protein [Novipirellula sp. SH528]|uniref:VOC family protein n=1 Tax=Novipirellula sp. SH528 TaxID=3454466 RepID=UPI003FA0C847